jgi:preprotein translocase subunit SecA
MESLGVEEDIPIEAGLVSKSIESAQTRVEGHNFDIRKHLLEYDDVVNQQREVIYAQRRRILSSPSLRDTILTMVTDDIQHLVATATASQDPAEWDFVTLHSAVRATMPLPATMTSNRWQTMDPQKIEEELITLAGQLYTEKEESLGPEVMRQLERAVMLRVVDNLWVRHLTDLDALREGIGLRAFGQQDPLVSFKREAHEMYGQLMDAIQNDIIHAVYRAQIVAAPQPRRMQAVHPSASGGDGAHKPARSEKRPGRNEPCWCGSGKKYKHCHLREDMTTAQSTGAKATAKPDGTATAQPTSGTPSARRRRRKRR